jgi:protein-disulfide isomerase
VAVKWSAAWLVEGGGHGGTSRHAAECASIQGRFAEFHDLLFAQQDSLGQKSLGEFAKEAGVPDLPAFVRCANSSLMDSTIEHDAQTAQRLGAMGTPAVLINGWLFGGAPTPATLDSATHAALLKGTGPT